ncbi:hypothetical protein EXIGLDRAFT_774959 [Exidia glandulosa HHB12029]|uniref:Uncharacterized protein n=1 Tax=Exidia glandulosa HHB12029 TaxID=1314781 RepID=A0A165ZVQ8_EXIGL|nr:hypothetical protein EXIGLDRAFT_774959 [Exidia glandulosa HHB12029]
MSSEDPVALPKGSAILEPQRKKKAASTKLESETTFVEGTNTPRSPPRWHVSSTTTSKPKGEDGIVVTTRLSNDGPIETTTTTTVTVDGTSTLHDQRAGDRSDGNESRSPEPVAALHAAKVVEDELAYIESKARDDGGKASTFPSLKDLLAALDELDQ